MRRQKRLNGCQVPWPPPARAGADLAFWRGRGVGAEAMYALTESKPPSHSRGRPFPLWRHRVDLTAFVSGDDWKRLLGGWRDISDDTRRLVSGLRALPDGCQCGDGQAHLAGRCPCCQENAASRPQCVDCAVLMHTVQWKLDAVVDDALRFLDPADQVMTSHVGDAAHAAVGQLRDELLDFVRVFEAVRGASGEFRVGCHSHHLTQLKELGEELGASARHLDTLLDGTNRSSVP